MSPVALWMFMCGVKKIWCPKYLCVVIIGEEIGPFTAHIM